MTSVSGIGALARDEATLAEGASGASTLIRVFGIAVLARDEGTLAKGACAATGNREGRSAQPKKGDKAGSNFI